MQRVVSAAFRLRTLSRPILCGTSNSVQIVNNPIASLSTSIKINMYSIVERGSLNTLEYRVYFKDESGNIISPFHDIPLYANKDASIVNMVVEIPRWTNAKMEIDTKGSMNPIKQDVKKGKLRFVNNCFPHHGYIWNYGALPQTWEDPKHIDENTAQGGDNDPIDICEIGYKVHPRGAVVQCKVLGVMALIDEGETDWKVIAIDVNDPLASSLNDIGDVEAHMPGFIKATHEWFRIYKIPTGKPENQFAFNGEAKDKAFAMKIIEQTYGQWENVMANKADAGGLALQNTTLGNEFQVSREEASAAVAANPEAGAPAPVEAEVDQWYYVKL